MEIFLTQVFTKNVRWILLGIAMLFLAALIFHAGVVVGSHEGFRPGGGRGFNPPFVAPGFALPDSFLSHGHGAVGTIATVTLPTLTITEPDGDTQTVFLSSTTLVDAGPHNTVSSSTLTPGRRVVIFGEPDTSAERIDAKVIHLLP